MTTAPPSTARPEAVVIGASCGAVDALLRLLPAVPRESGLPLLIVVHLPPDSDSQLAALLRARCSIFVKEAEDKEPIAPGTAYLAPPNYHLLVEPDRRLSLSCDDPVHYSRPSIDVLFETAADAYGPALAGIVLTGANADGARGLRAVADGGGATFVQAPESAEAPFMPEAALRATPSATTLTLEQLAAWLAAAAVPATAHD